MTLTQRLVPVESGTPVRICEDAHGGPICGLRASATLHVVYSPTFGGGTEQYDRCSRHPAEELRDMIRRSDPGARFTITNAGAR